MARPTTKKDVIEVGNDTFQVLMTLIQSLPKEAQVAPFTFSIEKEKGEHWKRDKNIKDVLIHLHEWHNLLIHWIESNQKGIEKQFLKEGYNWRTYGQMNVEFCKQHQDTTLSEAMQKVKKSHQQVMELVETFSNDALFSKNVFVWVGGSTLGSYFVSTTSSHYEWAIKKVKKHIKSIT